MGSSGCRYGEAFGKPPQVTVSTGRWKIQGKIKSEDKLRRFNICQVEHPEGEKWRTDEGKREKMSLS